MTSVTSYAAPPFRLPQASPRPLASPGWSFKSLADIVRDVQSPPAAMGRCTAQPRGRSAPTDTPGSSPMARLQYRRRVPDPRAEKRLGTEASGSPEGHGGRIRTQLAPTISAGNRQVPAASGFQCRGRAGSPRRRRGSHPSSGGRGLRRKTVVRPAMALTCSSVGRRPIRRTAGARPSPSGCMPLNSHGRAGLVRAPRQGFRPTAPSAGRGSRSSLVLRPPVTRHPLRWPGERDYRALPLRPDAGGRLSNRPAGCARRYLQLERG